LPGVTFRGTLACVDTEGNKVDDWDFWSVLSPTGMVEIGVGMAWGGYGAGRVVPVPIPIF